MKTTLKRRGNGELIVQVEARPSKVFGNVYLAQIYALDGHFDIEYYRENNSAKLTCIDVKYWVKDLKTAVKYAHQTLNYMGEK